MKTHHLSCGTARPPAGKLLNPTGLIVCHCVLIAAADTLVLIDSGVGLAAMEDPSRLGRLGSLMWRRRDPADAAIRQIERLGYRPEDVGHIVVTHLDSDHAAGLPDFPRAKVHVLRQEYEIAHSPRTITERDRYRPCLWAHGPEWMIHERPCGEPWYGFDCLRRVDGLPEEIVLVPLPGHTPGLCGVAVQTDSGWLLHCGDAYHDHRQIALDPRTPPLAKLLQRMVHLDGPAAHETLLRIRKLALCHAAEVQVFCSHDPEELEALRAYHQR